MPVCSIMRQSALLPFINLLAVPLLADIQASAIVCYDNSSFTQGVSRISIKVDSLDVFPTLGDVISFDQPAEVVGDAISFDLDGKRQHYRFVSCNATNAVLVAVGKRHPETVTLHGIPLLETFEMRHIRDSAVTIRSQGAISESHAKRLGITRNPPAPRIDVTYISPLDGKPKSLSNRP